jgi:hypothetical protein
MLYASNILRRTATFVTFMKLDLCSSFLPLNWDQWFGKYTTYTLHNIQCPLQFIIPPGRSRVSSVSIVSDYGLDNRAIGVRFPAGAKDFSSSLCARPTLRPTQPPVQWVLGVLSQAVKRGRGVMLTTHPHLVPRSRMSRSYIFSPPQASPWRVEGLLYFYFYIPPGNVVLRWLIAAQDECGYCDPPLSVLLKTMTSP